MKVGVLNARLSWRNMDMTMSKEIQDRVYQRMQQRGSIRQGQGVGAITRYHLQVFTSRFDFAHSKEALRYSSEHERAYVGGRAETARNIEVRCEYKTPSQAQRRPPQSSCQVRCCGTSVEPRKKERVSRNAIILQFHVKTTRIT